MKKVIGLIIGLSIVTSICIGITYGSETQKATDRRVISEFCELFMERAFRLQYTDHDYGIEPTALPAVINDSRNNRINVNTAAGYANISLDDLTIYDLMMTFFERDSDDYMKDYAICALAISALEYDLMDNYDMIDYLGTNAIEDAFDIVHEYIAPVMTSDFLLELQNTGQEYLVYSGNYDYYVSFYHSKIDDYESDRYMLIARTRK